MKAEIQATKNWVESIVIGLNLCPFAKRDWVKNRVRLVSSEANNAQSLLADLATEMTLLKQQSSLETTLLIHPFVLQDFAEYNDFLELVDVLIERLSLDGVFQVASFHPDYQFAESNADDVENYTNRSPYPMLHILRESSLEKAIEAHPDTEKISTNNIQQLRVLGCAHMRSLIDECSVK